MLITPFRILLIDDEAPARDVLRALLAERDDVELVLEAESANAASRILRSEDVNLVLLDIDLPDMSGVSLIRTIGAQNMPLTIFVTAYPGHALEAFELKAVDYLVKPLSRDRLNAALERAQCLLRSEEAFAGWGDAGEQNAPVAEAYPDKLVIKVGSQYVFERTHDVVWIEAEGNYVRIHLGSRSYVLRKTLAEIEAELDPQLFARVHRSSIVNLQMIRAVEPVQRGEYSISLTNGTRVSTGRLYRERVQRLIQRAG